ncbi:NAD(P)-binding protein [Penicillium capsulatum]|uniref:NAD(P)-binding protein n=1 Tax=Penicillium capsulatum TaxID=69766 RepID=A0A9W9I3D0_9EURO|nr:NAD(P)-binding protein [Penicillium capsulatum]KAJ6108784.1 NAD(P)-binding protein [Penicillium capsulatum]
MAQKYAKNQPQGFLNRIERVAIVGAGGSVGRHLAEAILKTGKHTLTAITRPGSTSQLPEGAVVVSVDYSHDDTALVEALRGQQALIVTMAVSAPKGTINTLIRAANKAGVPYVLPNWIGHDDSSKALLDDSLLGPSRDNILAEFENLSGTAYLFLVCNFWYEFSLGGGADRYGFDFKKRSFIQFDDGDVIINTTTWPQCGRALASLLSLKEFPDDEADQAPTLSQFANRSVYISSFRLSQRDMFESVKRVTGTSEADWKITYESSEQRWKDGQADVKKGNFAAFPKQLYSRMFFPNGDGDYESRRELHNEILGLPVEDLDEYTAIAIRMGENDELNKGH